uniref:beta-N-acetylhexosaminidase n=1 Tax=Angiostrongylus cantonensis TaxID=6313 RepID=A0A158P741_ANGCA
MLTGVLIEWEDMFPWNGELEIVRSTNAYKISEVQGILRKARSPQGYPISFQIYLKVICIGNENSVKLVKKIISQVVNVHKPFGIKRFHIGADEGFQFGVCNESQKLARRLGSSTQLAIEYLGTIANYVKNITNGATILAWHDMIKQFIISGEVLSKLGTLLQPVIWDYSEELETMSTEDFLAFADNFPKMWASSAFKGANTPSSKYMDYEHYQKNNLQWITTQRLLRYNSGLAFEGMIITGWSRGKEQKKKLPEQARKIFTLNGYEAVDPWLLKDGRSIQLGNINGNKTEHPKSPPSSPSITYFSPTVVTVMAKDMRKLFHNLTVDEFFFDNIDPLVEKLTDYVINAQSLLNFETYKQRNFGIHRSKLALLS